MKISKIHVLNFLGIKDVEINPSHTNIITGKNKQGKTSILKAIKTALTGEGNTSEIRIGEDKAEIRIDMEEFQIKRTLTPKGNYLDVTTTEGGYKVPSPQKFLDGLIGTFAFNPIEFFELKPAEQKKYLLNAIDMKLTQEGLAKLIGQQLAGIDYEHLHALEVVELARKHFYEERTGANAVVTQKRKVLEDLKTQIPADFDAAAVDPAKIEELRKKVSDAKIADNQYENDKQAFEASTSRLLSLKEELAKEEEKHANLRQAVEEYETAVTKPNIPELEAEISTLEGQRDLVHTAGRRDEVRTELDEAMSKATELDEMVKKLTKDVPEQLIKEAKLPVAGLTLSDDGILVDGKALANLSTSEQLKFGLDVVRALNEKFKVICVDGIEALDPQSFEAFLKEIEPDDFQYFLTRVDTGLVEKNGHVIQMENGEIQSESKN